MTQTVSKEENKTLSSDRARQIMEGNETRREMSSSSSPLASSSMNAIVMRHQAARVRRTGHRSKKRTRAVLDITDDRGDRGQE